MVCRDEGSAVISLQEAKDFVLRDLRALEPEEMILEGALGCAVATDVIAREQVPSFLNSSMDGFTFRAVDTSPGGARLNIVGSILAGRPSPRTLEPGEAMRIMTGAPLPEGADTVCRIEDLTIEDDHVVVPHEVAVGACVRVPGDDVRVGQVLVTSGSELTPTALAVMAGQGLSSVWAYRRPVVGVLSTGDELALTTEALVPGQIRDLNRPLVLGLVREVGMIGVDLGVVADDRDEIARRLTDAIARCDVVISTGGVSVGDVDHVKGVIGDLAAGRSRSVQVAIKPAKPFAFGLVGNVPTPVFGLPGNPVSTRVSFEMFVRPALRTLGGHHLIERPRILATLDISLPAPVDGKIHLVHVSAIVGDDGRIHVIDAARHNSHLMSAIVNSNAIAILEPGGSYGVGEGADVVIVGYDSLARS